MRIKSFEELFPDNEPRYISPIERLLPKIDQEINDIIAESYGVSFDVIDIVNELVKQIEDSINYGEFDDYNGDLNDVYFIDDISANKSKQYIIDQTFCIKNMTFDVSLILMNYDNIGNDEFDKISTLNVVANTKYITSTHFFLTCFIPTKNFKMNEIGLRVLNHEIMHSWQHYNKNINDKKEKEYLEWNKLYYQSVNILHKKYNDETELIAKSVYYSDLRELAAFTQQSYIEIKDISNSNVVHSKIKKTELYKGANNIKSAIEYLNNNELPSEFNGLIQKKKLLFILKKRYYQYKKNIARLIIAQKEILEEGAGYLDSTKLDWIYINPFGR